MGDTVSVVNREGPEELKARDLVASALGVQLQRADVTGGVDYRFERPNGRSGAVEVTTLTDRRMKKAIVAWLAEQERSYEPTRLANSWMVTVPTAEARHRGLPQRLEPALAALEAAGVTKFDRWRGTDQPAAQLAEPLEVLRREGVIQAEVVATKDLSIRRVFVTTMGGFAAKGSDASLEIIEDYLRDTPDNLLKLTQGGTAERHLFLWLDGQTPGEVARPFTGGRAGEMDHFGLPTREPRLPEAVTDLWIVHLGTGIGWRWTPDMGWAQVQTPK